MKIVISMAGSLIVTALFAACSSGSNGAAAPTPPPPVAISGIDTPKSVSVVTAN